MFAESHHLPGIGLRYERSQSRVVQCMSGFVSAKLPQQTVAQQVQVSNSIQHLVADEFVLEAQPILVEDTVLIHHDSVVNTATPGETLGPQILYLMDEAKGPGATEFLDKRGGGKVQLCVSRTVTKNGVVKIDGK